MLRAGLALGLVALPACPADAADNISGFVDDSGRVVFVNEPVAEPAAPNHRVSKAASSDGRKLLAKATSHSFAESMTAVPAAPGEQVQFAAAEQDSPPVPAGRVHIQELVSELAEQHKVDADLIHAVVRVESNYNPYAVSGKGARGLMQLIPATARRFGVQNSFDPRANLEGGIRYLKHLMTMFNGDLRLSLAAYNAGEMAVTRYGGVPPYRETQNYIRKISELYPMHSVAVAAGVAPEPQIVKYVDESGVVHFSNTELP